MLREAKYLCAFEICRAGIKFAFKANDVRQMWPSPCLSDSFKVSFTKETIIAKTHVHFLSKVFTLFNWSEHVYTDKGQQVSSDKIPSYFCKETRAELLFHTQILGLSIALI